MKKLSDLTESEYHVLIEKGTEPPFSHIYNRLKAKGIFTCKFCSEPLFHSDAKYDSGSGWPSFYKPYTENALTVTTDTSHGMIRKEITCYKCGSHLGHVFEGEPTPSSLRYCVNGLSLDFEIAENKEE